MSHSAEEGRMRIMVLGATGFIGPAVVRRLLARGCEALAVARSPAAAGDGVVPLALDRRDTEALGAAASRLRPDAVIDLLALTLTETAELLEALAGRTGRYVMASSGDVYAQYDRLHRHAAGPALDVLDEGAPLRTRLYPYRAQSPRAPESADAWMDDYDKIPIERAVSASDLPWSTVRLPMVFGPGDKQRRFAWAVGPMLRGADVLEVDAAWAKWRCSYGFVDDVAEALVLAALHPTADGQVFNAGPAAAAPHLDWARRLAAAAGWRGDVRFIPRHEVPGARRGALDALDLACPLALDTQRIRQALGYREVIAPEEALRLTIEEEARSAFARRQ
jgi:nucleoside-diphosphate-sugar epimerase